MFEGASALQARLGSDSFFDLDPHTRYSLRTAADPFGIRGGQPDRMHVVINWPDGLCSRVSDNEAAYSLWQNAQHLAAGAEDREETRDMITAAKAAFGPHSFLAQWDAQSAHVVDMAARRSRCVNTIDLITGRYQLPVETAPRHCARVTSIGGREYNVINGSPAIDWCRQQQATLQQLRDRTGHALDGLTTYLAGAMGGHSFLVEHEYDLRTDRHLFAYKDWLHYPVTRGEVRVLEIPAEVLRDIGMPSSGRPHPWQVPVAAQPAFTLDEAVVQLPSPPPKREGLAWRAVLKQERPDLPALPPSRRIRR